MSDDRSSSNDEKAAASYKEDVVVPEQEPSGGLLSAWKRPDNSAFFQEALQKYGGENDIDPVRAKRLLRKIDYIILPQLAVCYFFYYVDKTTLSYAAIFGIKDDLNLVGTRYSWLSSVFYFGWLVWAMPSNLLMQRSPAGSYLALNIFLWGAFLMAQAGAKKYSDMVILRVISGAAESIADPAFMLITSMWYTRAEQPSRISAWYAANGLGVAGGGLIGYGIGHIKGSLASWRYEFIIVGAFCCFWACLLFALLPNSLATSRWFSRDDRLFLVARVAKNQTGLENHRIKWDHVRCFFTDIKSYMFFILGFVANIPNGGISNFSTLIIKGLGFDTFHTTLLGIPQGVFVVIWIGAGALLNGRLPANSRTIVCMLFMLPTIAGCIGFLLAPNNAYVGRLICFYLTGSYQASFVLALSLITSNVGGQTKKQLTSAIIWMGACVGNIAGPFFFKSNQAPSYRLGIGAMLVANCIELLIFALFRAIFIWENKKRDRLAAENKSGAAPSDNQTAFADLTDRQNPNFRYVY
ncbi:MFS general substrate transporter [Serendipita vermifera]|nr:MFS general substrate transporter [Serendipita vermifera]